MIELLAEIFGYGPAFVATAALLIARTGGAMALMPALGEQVVSARVKLVLTLVVSALIGPMLWQDLLSATQTAGWSLLLFAETITGLVIGIAFRFLVIVLQIAGSIAAQTISLAQLFGGGMGPEPQPAFSSLFVVAGLCVAVMAGLHVQVCKLFIVSYDIFPAGQFIDPLGVFEWGAARVSEFFALGLSLASPFVLVAIVYNTALGIINRAMPQLMVAFVGAPAISLAALAVLVVAAPLLIFAWLQLASDLFNSQDLGFR